MLQGLLVDLVPYDARFTARDLEWINGPMREWWGQDGLITAAEQERRREQRQLQPNRAAFGIQTKDGRPIGMEVLRDINWTNRHAEVGAGIGDPAYWGGGYGSDAMLLITEYAFNWLDLRRLWLNTMGHNVRAQRQVEKCGFVREGVHRLAVQNGMGGYRDRLIYGLMRDEWPGRAALVEQLGLREKAAALGMGEGAQQT
jgi:RimJ/RimL family protein N-acetyltransferase